MKILALILIVVGFYSCNSENKSEDKNPKKEKATTKTDETVEAPNKNLQEINTNEALIATALMAAPEDSRADCKVIGYNMEGEFVTLKEGENEFICLANNPKKDGFSAACYHKSLEPFMARGRELRAEGKSRSEIFEAREKEVKSGQLTMGDPGTTLHIYYGETSNYDPETSEVDGAIYRYVVYMPWATAASTGLPESPYRSNHPWIMNPGTHKAHIMISPLAEGEE